jgi:hypothetical protein
VQNLTQTETERKARMLSVIVLKKIQCVKFKGRLGAFIWNGGKWQGVHLTTPQVVACTV